mgnify:CR=1 FL=1
MKTIFITINNSFQARDLLRSDFFILFRKNRDWRIVLLVPLEKFDHYLRMYGGGNVIVEICPTIKDKLNKFETLSYLLGHKSIATNTIKILHDRLKRRPLIYLVSSICWYLGHYRPWREFIRWLFARATNGRHFSDLFDKYKPDLVYAVNLLNFDEFRLLTEARKRGVKTCALILSWDNLNSKLFIYAKAYSYVVPGKLVKQELIQLGDISSNCIEVVGLAKYDGYFQQTGVIGREEFMKKIGLPPENKLIVYCLSTRNTSPVYEDIIADLCSIKREEQLSSPSSWLIRGYPKYSLPAELIAKINDSGIVYNHPSDFSSDARDYEIRDDDDVFLHNLFYHGDVFITNYSTVVVEASIYDKPVININYDGRQEKPYPWSVKRIRDYTHYRQVISAKAEDPANSKEDLVVQINKCLNQPELRRQGRARVVREQCAFTDGQSGRRMYEYLISLIP